MISFLRRHRKSFFIATIAVFLVGTFVGLGGYLLTSKDTQGVVASVGSTKIPYNLFLRRVDQYVNVLRDRGTAITDDVVKQVKAEMLQEMIVDELLLLKADEMGLIVTDEDLARDIRNTPAFQRGGAYSQEAEDQAVRTIFHDTTASYEETRRKTMKINMLKKLIFQTAKLAPSEVQEAYAKANKGSMKDFDKSKDTYEARLQQQRALEVINYYLRQISAQVEVRNFLPQRESGV